MKVFFWGFFLCYNYFLVHRLIFWTLAGQLDWKTQLFTYVQMPQARVWSHYISTLVLLLPDHHELNSYFCLGKLLLYWSVDQYNNKQKCSIVVGTKGWCDRVGSVPLRVILPQYYWAKNIMRQNFEKLRCFHKTKNQFAIFFNIQ